MESGAMAEGGKDANGGERAAADAALARSLREAVRRVAATRALAAATPLERLTDLIVRTAARTIPSPEGALFLVNLERRALTFDTVIGSTAAAVLGTTIPLGHGIAGLVAVSGQPLAVADAQRDPRHARDVAERSRYFPKSILAVPVVAADGSVVGVLELLDRRGQPTYDLADIELLGFFAGQLAIVLEQRRVVTSATALVAHALRNLTGLPDATARALHDRIAAALAPADSDAVDGRTRQLAELVARIASRGPDEQATCLAVLAAFADYAQTKAGSGSDAEWAY
jgi:GAF domain-containing protein